MGEQGAREVSFFCGPWDGEDRKVATPLPPTVTVPTIGETTISDVGLPILMPVFTITVYRLYEDEDGAFYVCSS